MPVDRWKQLCILNFPKTMRSSSRKKDAYKGKAMTIHRTTWVFFMHLWRHLTMIVRMKVVIVTI